MSITNQNLMLVISLSAISPSQDVVPIVQHST